MSCSNDDHDRKIRTFYFAEKSKVAELSSLSFYIASFTLILLRMYYWDDPFLVSYDKDQLNNGKNLLFTSFGNTTFHFSLIDKLTHTLSISPCEIKYFNISSVNTNQFFEWKQYVISNHNNQIKPILLVIGNTNKINNNNLLELQQLNILFKLSDYTSDLTNIITLLTIDIDFGPTNETLGTRHNYDTFKWKHYLQSKWKSSFVEFNTNALIGRISRAVIQSPSEPFLPLPRTHTTYTNSIHAINESTIRLLCPHNSNLLYTTRLKFEEFYAYTQSTYKLGYDLPIYTKLQHFGHNISTISTLSIIFYTFLFVCFYIVSCCRPKRVIIVASKPTSVPPPTNDTTTAAVLPSPIEPTTIPSTTTEPTTDTVISSTIEVKLTRSSRSRYNVQLAEAASTYSITRSSRPSTRRGKPNLIDVEHTVAATATASASTTSHAYIDNVLSSSSTQAVPTRDATSIAAVTTVTTRGRSISRTRARAGASRRPLRARSSSKKSD